MQRQLPHTQASIDSPASVYADAGAGDGSTSASIRTTSKSHILQMMIMDDSNLLTEIFLWLPAKSLIRFKLVCKRWFSLISCHHFALQHTLHQCRRRQRSRQEPSLLLRLAETSNYLYLQQCPYGQKWLPYNFAPTLTEPTIWSFSNGLFLLQCRNVENKSEDYYIYNPTTKESRKILLNSNEKYRCILGLNLAFDPSKSPHYKIVCVRASRRRSSLFWRSWWRRCQIETYESDTGTWKLYGEPFLAPTDVQFDRGIYWKGGIHWHGIFFDLHENAVRKHPEVVFPEDPRTQNVYYHYIESNGHLHYITHFVEEKTLMVFELQIDYSQWSLKYHISLEKSSGPLSVLTMYRGDSEEESTLVLHEPGKVMAYNLQENCFKELVDFTGQAFYQEHLIQCVSHCTFQFIETLAPA